MAPFRSFSSVVRELEQGLRTGEIVLWGGEPELLPHHERKYRFSALFRAARFLASLLDPRDSPPQFAKAKLAQAQAQKTSAEADQQKDEVFSKLADAISKLKAMGGTVEFNVLGLGQAMAEPKKTSQRPSHALQRKEQLKRALSSLAKLLQAVPMAPHVLERIEKARVRADRRETKRQKELQSSKTMAPSVEDASKALAALLQQFQTKGLGVDVQTGTDRVVICIVRPERADQAKILAQQLIQEAEAETHEPRPKPQPGP